MKVSFHKKKDGSTVMTITRSDGSSTWSTLRRGMEIHDLAHLVVEGTLRCTDSFFGMIERGADIDDFEDKTKQPDITIESQQVEHLVLLLQIDFQQGSLGDEFLRHYSDMLIKYELPQLKGLNPESLREIREKLALSSKNLCSLSKNESFNMSLDLICDVKTDAESTYDPD